MHTVYLACEVVCHGKVECCWMEVDITPAKPRPAVSSTVDPADEVEVIYILNCAKVRALRNS